VKMGGRYNEITSKSLSKRPLAVFCPAIPEFTRSADIKLNAQLSLRQPNGRRLVEPHQ